MLVSTALIASLLSLAATLVVLGWVYHRTHLPAVLVYLGWTLLSRSVLPWATKVLVDRAPPLAAGHAPLPIGSWLAIWSATTSVIGSALFIWFLIALMQWARPQWLSAGRSRLLPVPER